MNNNDVAQFRLKPLHAAIAAAVMGVGVVATQAVATESTFTAERIVVAASCNPCAAKCNPCAAKCNPCAAKCNPCAAKCNPCAAKCNPCAAKCNPCAAKCNPCAAKCNPCAAKKCNPCGACNPCNPCGASSVNPCAVKRNPCTAAAHKDCNPCALITEGKALWADPKFSTNGLACATCHVGGQAAFNKTFGQAYPHPVAMATAVGIKEMTAEEMVQFCLVQPMASKTLPWDSRELAALTAYTLEVQKGFNPCAATGGACNPCNPCAAKCNPCNPCAAKKCNPCAAKCNPCAAKCNPCNPCAAKKTSG